MQDRYEYSRLVGWAAANAANPANPANPANAARFASHEGLIHPSTSEARV
jgi:hypothetical protein